jgi:prepilin-type N-terminal cleavage/methylation domain-containing protein
MRYRAGYSLIELVFVLMLMAILLGIVTAPVARMRDVLAVRGARSELAALVAVTRSTAIAAGGATLVVDVEAGSAWIESGGARVGDVQHIAGRHHVELTSSRARLSLRYDALGIGRMSNAVVRVKSGGVTGTITISAYGRVRES